MQKRLMLSWLFICLSASGFCASYTYDYNENCRLAYVAYMSLHMREGRALIVKEMTAHPYNLMATYISDYEDCIILLLNCDPADYEQRIGHFEYRLGLLDHGQVSSPWYRFCEAGVYLHLALVYTRFGEQYRAAVNFRKSFSLLKENRKLFPRFGYNDIFFGLQDALLGALPGNYRWVAAIFGMKGNVKKGTALLAGLVNKDNDLQPLHAETAIYYALTRFYLLGEQKEAWEFLNSSRFPANSLLHIFTKATIGLDDHQADAVTAALQRAMSDPYYSAYPIFEYLVGLAALAKLDTGCVEHFRRYVTTDKSGLYVKDAWLKMAFAYYIINDKASMTRCVNMVKTQGSLKTDADRQANKLAERGIWPPVKLLQARLLTEGGYSPRALDILRSIDRSQLEPPDRLEYLYRTGRAYELAGDNGKAVEYYRFTIAEGRDRSEQYAARAALQTAQLYEHLGQKDKALAMYRECLDMPAHDFQNSIDQQARAGINRLEGG